MVVTATEFKSNLGKYFDYVMSSPSEAITITRNGKKVAEFSAPRITAVEKLTGFLNEDGKAKKRKTAEKDYDDLKREALKEKYEIDI